MPNRYVTRPFRYVVLALLLALSACQRPDRTRPDRTRPAVSTTYYPPKGDAWVVRAPAQVGMDAAKLAEAVAWAKTQETMQMKPDFSTQEEIFGKLLGPMPASRAATNGIILRHGYIVAEWGDTRQADPTYSVAKSVLSTLAGISHERGLIPNVQAPVRELIRDGGYDSEQNRAVTWEHHLRQTSEWEGELWGKNADFVGRDAFGQGERKPRSLRPPGTYYEYNDVRINRMALSLLRLWKKPLPDVVRDELLGPIGASDSWRYVPYPTAVAEVDGKMLPSVSGGTRWGGGLWISARDLARFGYLFLRQGRWQQRSVVSPDWVQQATAPNVSVANSPDYGYLWWLNTGKNESGKRAWPDAPSTSFAALGAGPNTVWIDPKHDLVIIWRWHNGSPNELIKRVLASIN